MIPQHLSEYVKVYENHLSLDLCKSACEHLQNINWQEHTFHHVGTDTFVSYDHELSISNENIPEKEEINKQVWFALEQYILKDFASFGDWFAGWQGYSSVRFNRYDETTQMKLHCDHIHTLFDGQRRGVPVLTVLGALNDDYEGGELVMCGDQQIHLSVGSVVVFPSNFMFPHEVKPVKSGTRFSYVSWSW